LDNIDIATILVRNYNGKELLEGLLPDLSRVVKNRGQQDEILVVDDGSTDGSARYVRKHFPGVHLKALAENTGNSIMPVNIGVQNARNEIVICLDSDVRVDSDFITPMLKNFEDNDVFAVCPKIINPNHGNTVESVNYPVFRKGRIVGEAFGMTIPHLLPLRPSFVWYAPGNAAAYRRDRFQALNGLDPLYRPFYYEDMDVCQRAWRRGWSTIFEPEATTYHLRHVTTQKLLKNQMQFEIYRTKNQLLFAWKNLLDSKLISLHLIWIFLHLANSIYNHDLVFRRALRSAILQLPEALKARRGEIRAMKLTDKEIFKKLNSNGLQQQ
jgi:GT2 family glycosyltransferase